MKKFALYFSLFALILIIVEVYLRYWSISTSGLLLAFNEPGKVFTHLFIFPAVAYLVISNAPINLYKKLLTQRLVLVVFIAGVILVSAITAIGFQDAHRGFCDRLPTPPDFRNKEMVDRSNNSWWTNHKKLKGYFESGISSDSMTKLAQTLHNNYSSLIDSLRPEKCSFEEGFNTRCNFWSNASIKAKIDVGLTTLFISIGIFFLVSLLLFIIFKCRPSREQLQAYQMILLLSLAWLPLRRYTEWYINFGTKTGYSDLLLTIILFVIILFFYIRIIGFESAKKVKDHVVFIAGIVELLLNTAFEIKEDWFYKMSKSFHNFNFTQWGVTYVLILILLVGLYFSYMSEIDKSIQNNVSSKKHKK